jgi:hypothetical protein
MSSCDAKSRPNVMNATLVVFAAPSFIYCYPYVYLKYLLVCYVYFLNKYININILFNFNLSFSLFMYI